jgi:hypothetical protein
MSPRIEREIEDNISTKPGKCPINTLVVCVRVPERVEFSRPMLCVRDAIFADEYFGLGNLANWADFHEKETRNESCNVVIDASLLCTSCHTPEFFEVEPRHCERLLVTNLLLTLFIAPTCRSRHQKTKK